MSAFKKAKAACQRVIDEYLSETGRNLYIPAEFIDWLADQPDHEAYAWFYGKDDATLAREARINMARQMASGLRIVARVSTAPSQAQTVNVVTREYPAYISPQAGRRDGGGYHPFNPDDVEAMTEMQRQAATGLRAWLSRYRGTVEAGGHDLSHIEALAEALSPSVSVEAA